MKKKLRRILNSKYLYIFLCLLTIVYVLFNLSITRKSGLNVEDKEFTGVLKKVTIKESKVSYYLDLGSETLIANEYLKENQVAKYDDFVLGSKIKVTGDLKEPTNNTIPNTFNYKKYLYYHNIFYTCTVKSREVIDSKINIFYKLKNFVVKRIMSYDISDYLYTLIVGDKSLMDEDTFDKFRLNGVTHLFAISGMHIGLFSGILIKILQKLKLGEKKSYIVTIIFIWVYAFLTGFSPSVKRACLLFSILSISKCLELDIKALYVLFLTGFILIFLDYKIIMDIGFIYSFTITFGLMYSGDYLKKHKVIGTSLVATLYSIPITILNFYKINLLGLFNNLLFVPLVASIVYPLSLLTFVFRFLEPVAKISIYVLEFLNDMLSSVTLLNIVVPKAGTLFVIVYYLMLLIFFKNKPTRTTIFLLLLVLASKLTIYLDISYHVEVLDVGQGDSILIRAPHAKDVILIDTGGVVSYTNKNSSYHVAENTITYLNSLGINEIDTFILSHGDFDHMGDAKYIIDNIKVKKIIFNNDDYNELEQELIKILDKKKIKYYRGFNELNINEYKLQFLNTKIYDNENDNSNVIYFNCNNYKFLFMGDAGVMREKDILDMYDLEDIDFLKVGHHGSDTSSSSKFIGSIKPKYSLISVGKNNRYGHPKESVLDVLSKTKIYRTDLDGSIEIVLNKKGYMFKTCPP